MVRRWWRRRKVLSLVLGEGRGRRWVKRYAEVWEGDCGLAFNITATTITAETARALGGYDGVSVLHLACKGVWILVDFVLSFILGGGRRGKE